MPDGLEKGSEDRFDFNHLLKEFDRGKLPLSRVREHAGDRATLSFDGKSAISQARRDGENVQIVIGKKPFTHRNTTKWGWGTEEGRYTDQILVKMAHEYAHVVQHRCDKDLLAWLDHGINPPEPSLSYVLLYGLLSTLALHRKDYTVTGLAADPVYAKQNQETGRLRMSVYEDIAELLGAWMLGENYFKFRLERLSPPLKEKEAARLRNLLDGILEVYLGSPAPR